MADLPAIERLRQALQAVPRPSSTGHKPTAAVAAILHHDERQLRLLFIQRAECDGDPWSGHLGFPGGRREAGDVSLRAAAERETGEEVGLDLTAATYLGRLADVTGCTLPVDVAAFAYLLPAARPALTLNYEVHDAFWVPLTLLRDPANVVRRRFPFRGLEDRELPAIRISSERPLLWGITHRLTEQLLDGIGH